MTGFPDVFTPAAVTQFALGVNFWDTPYNGLVDELKLYDEAIALENVQQLYAERRKWELIPRFLAIGDGPERVAAAEACSSRVFRANGGRVEVWRYACPRRTLLRPQGRARFENFRRNFRRPLVKILHA